MIDSSTRTTSIGVRKNRPIDLERRFLRVRDVGDRWIEEEPFWTRGYGSIAWEELLRERFVVVFGEAGSGKTTELRQQPALLRDRGALGFFLDVTSLARHGPELAVEPDSRSCLIEWKHRPTATTFLLDAVDEAQLRNNTLADALHRLAEYAGDAASLSRLVVSTRGSDWDESSSLPALQAYARHAGDDDPAISLFRLAPLGSLQVSKLALAAGVNDVKEFLAAIERAGVQPLVTRPLDVEWMATAWLADRELGSLTDILHKNIGNRLQERRPNSCPSPPLSRTRAMEGLRRLAGMATLTGKWFFFVEPSQAGDDALSPNAILSSWSPSEVSALLTTAIFDEATYGRLRIHHRAVQEFLAAEWLTSPLLGASDLELDSLLFKRCKDRVSIPKHLRATAAWIAGVNTFIRRRIVEIEPSLLVGGGDPGSLLKETRESALDSYLTKYQEHDQLFERFDPATLRRFAPSLEEPVAEYLEKRKLPEEGIRILLEIAESGSLASCRSAAERLFRESTSPSVRCQAARVLDQVLETSSRVDFARAAIPLLRGAHQDTVGVFATSFLDVLLPAEVVQLLKDAAPAAPNYHTVLKSFATYTLPNDAKLEEIPPLLCELRSAIAQEERDAGWLLHAAARLASRFLKESPRQCSMNPEILATLETIRSELSRRKHFSTGAAAQDELREVVSESPELRRWNFWQLSREYVRKHGEWPAHPFLLEGSPEEHGLLSEQDVEWMAADACQQREEGARALAVATLFQWSDESKDAKKALEDLSQTGPEDVKSRVQDQLAKRERGSGIRENDYAKAFAQRRSEAVEAKRQEERLRLEAIESELSTGKATAALAWLCHRFPSERSELGVDIQDVAEAYGDKVAKSAASGFRRFWRTYKPPFRCEQDNRSDIPQEVFVGLAGLALELTEQGAVAALLPEELAIAVRYAARQLNRLPSWFGNIPSFHGDTVAAALRPALESALRPSGCTDILSKWDQFPAVFQEAVGEVTYPALCSFVKTNPEGLKLLLRLASGLPDPIKSAYVELAKDRIDADISTEEAVEWWLFLAATLPGQAAAHLDEFTRNATRSDAEQVGLAIFSRLGERYKKDRSVTSVLSSWEALETLIPIVFSLIREKDDLQHDTGEAYFISKRDEAETFRKELLPALSRVGGKDAVAALERLQQIPSLLQIRDRIEKQIRLAAELTPDALPMDVRSAVKWANDRQAPVRTAAGLYDAVVSRVRAIKRKVEEGESSSRALLAKADERELQPHIANELESLNNIGYTVSREEEGDRFKKPDFRIHHSACHKHPTTIELKIADNWSRHKLRQALTHQLLGQYIRRDKSRHGILLLCWQGKKLDWKAGGSTLSFAAIVRELDEMAQSLVLSGRAEGLSVIGISFK